MRKGDLFRLEGKAALVTGASKGLGRMFAQALAEAGASVLCADIDSAPLFHATNELRSRGYEAQPVIADVSSPGDVRDMVEAVKKTYGRLDIGVNNAGIVTPPCRFHEIPQADWDRLIAVDLTGVFLCMQEELRVMVEQKSGSIVNIASVAGLRGVSPEHKPRANYVAAKHGVVGLTRQAALEYASEGIRVNALAPGWFAGTQIGRERIGEKHDQDALLQKTRDAFVPMGRKGTPEELQGIILYLASDASAYTSGQVFAIDGGVTAR